jgi:hypothetical protein
MRTSKYRAQYLPAVAFLNSHLQPNNVVFGRSELYFGLLCRACLKDDVRLGANSGKHADFLVLDTDYRKTIAGFAFSEKSTYRFIEELLSGGEYIPVFRNDLYEVFQRTTIESRSR